LVVVDVVLPAVLGLVHVGQTSISAYEMSHRVAAVGASAIDFRPRLVVMYFAIIAENLMLVMGSCLTAARNC
ncbi:hypothetical protein, partial [Enterococcus faecalis]|uniref:hypothetical protein n=1 Tax=Enterococcus faecalis TaxID=1351 RepID=UPI003D6BB209